MPKTKLTIDAKDVARLKNAAEFKEAKLEDARKFGDQIKVVVSTRSSSDLFSLGVAFEQMKNMEVGSVALTDAAVETKPEKPKKAA